MPILSELIASDVENSQDVLNSILSSPSDAPAPEATTTKKAGQARKQQKSQKAAKPKAVSKAAEPKVADAEPKAAPKKATAKKRKAAEEPVNEAEPNKETAPAQDTQQPKSRGRTTAAKAQKAQKAQKARPKAASPKPAENIADANTRPVKRAKQSRMAAPAPAEADPDTEPEAEADVDTDTVQSEAEEVVPEPAPARQRNSSRQNSRVRAQPVARRRAGSASDTERADPALRRKLGDITRKFENVELKYRTLKEVGISEANANMEKLRQRCEASTLASNQLIASLKKELASQAPLARDAQKIKSQMHSQEIEMAKLHSTATELAASLAAAQNEIKALQAKLSAARASSVAAEGRTPARESKKEPRAPLVPASEAVQIAQMKEELYSDLTGLIVRGVKRSADGDTYDCIQTGRNGTLHFKLFVDAEDAKSATFEDTDFLYTPLLDANRDRDLIELMPTYLTEEITFARQNAAKFYGRVLDTLTKRRADE